MTTIRVRLHFSFPFDFAVQYLREELDAYENGVRELTLSARIPATHIRLSKNVLVRCERDASQDLSWKVRWVPEPGGIYPTFEGTLRASPREDRFETILDLTGTYTPPLGIAGEAFDHLLGRKIAVDTAYDFLADAAAEIKARYALEEAREVFREFDADEAPLPAGDVPERLR